MQLVFQALLGTDQTGIHLILGKSLLSIYT